MKKADIWALGITLYCMVFNKVPFDVGGTDIMIMERVLMGRITYESRKISSDLEFFLSRILEKDPDKRASLGELLGTRFITSQGKDGIGLLKKNKSFKYGHGKDFCIKINECQVPD